MPVRLFGRSSRKTYVVLFEVSGLSQRQFSHIDDVMHEIIIGWRHILKPGITVPVSKLPLVFQAAWVMPVGFAGKNTIVLYLLLRLWLRSKKGRGTDCGVGEVYQ